MHLDENAFARPVSICIPSQALYRSSATPCQNDNAEALDRKCTIILVMLDLSCAFDKIDHELLKIRLELSFGITDKALPWLQSYIRERYQKVAVGYAESIDSILMWALHCIARSPNLSVERDEPTEAAIAKVELDIAEVDE